MATSPIQGGPATQQGPMSVASAATTGEDVTADGKRSLPKGAHVRFSTVEMDGASTDGNRISYSNFSYNVIHSFQNLFKEPVILISGNVSSTANQTSTANITSTINGAIITTCSFLTGTTCHMTAASATSTHVEHAAATCITTAAILETRTTSMDTGPQRQTGKSTTSQKTPGGTHVLHLVQY